MFDAFKTLWARLSLLARLLAAASLALMVASSLLLLVLARQESSLVQKNLAEELANELEILPAALAEVAVIGDFATLQQTLDQFTRRSNVLRAEYRDPTGARVLSEDRALPLEVPRWFSEAMGFSDLAGQAPVSVGGRVYGELYLTLSIQNQARHAWSHLLYHLGILLLSVMLNFFGIWGVLRNGLLPIKHLEQGASALAQGHLETRLIPAGSPELRHLIAAFNRMAAALQNSRDRLAQSSAEQQRFAEITAHHLQEPTRRIARFAQRLSRRLSGRLTDEDDCQSLTFIEQQARRLSALMRDVQRYLALDHTGTAGRVESRPVLARVIAASLEAAEAEIVIHDPLPRVWFPPKHLHEIFAILLDNALRYRRPDRPLRLDISAQVSGSRATFRFNDNGLGIVPEYRDQVFGLFTRLVPHSEAQPGTGMGLALLRKSVRMAGGQARVEDGLDGGVCLVFDLPIEETL